MLSSHLVSDVERACDYLVVLVDSRVQVAGDIEHLLATHHRLTGPRRDPATLPGDQHVVTASHTDRQSTYLVRTEAPILDPAWEVSRLTSRTSSSPTWAARRAERDTDSPTRPWRHCDDLADLAPVPRLRAVVLGRAGGGGRRPRGHRPAARRPVARAAGEQTSSTGSAPMTPRRRIFTVGTALGVRRPRRRRGVLGRPDGRPRARGRAPTGWSGTRASPGPAGSPPSSAIAALGGARSRARSGWP